MPFANPLARSFTASSIRMNAPALPGIYGISNSREWIFISASQNIQGSLIEHFSNDQQLRETRPTGFVFEVCYLETQNARCERLIREYSPLRNIPSPDPAVLRSGERPRSTTNRR